MGDTHPGHAWVPPDRYRLCEHGSCGESKATGPAKDVAEWECEETDHCKPEGEHKCACYLVRVPPRSHHVEILAAPGKKWTWEPMPPGWHTMCLCLHEDKDANAPPPPKLELTAPPGCTISDKCGDCGMPSFDRTKRTWSCVNLDAHADPGCFLVEVPREGKYNKQLHILAGPGRNQDIHESHLHSDWDVILHLPEEELSRVLAEGPGVARKAA